MYSDDTDSISDSYISYDDTNYIEEPYYNTNIVNLNSLFNIFQNTFSRKKFKPNNNLSGLFKESIMARYGMTAETTLKKIPSKCNNYFTFKDKYGKDRYIGVESGCIWETNSDLVSKKEPHLIFCMNSEHIMDLKDNVTMFEYKFNTGDMLIRRYITENEKENKRREFFNINKPYYKDPIKLNMVVEKSLETLIKMSSNGKLEKTNINNIINPKNKYRFYYKNIRKNNFIDDIFGKQSKEYKKQLRKLLKLNKIKTRTANQMDYYNGNTIQSAYNPNNLNCRNNHTTLQSYLQQELQNKVLKNKNYISMLNNREKQIQQFNNIYTNATYGYNQNNMNILYNNINRSYNMYNNMNNVINTINNNRRNNIRRFNKNTENSPFLYNSTY